MKVKSKIWLEVDGKMVFGTGKAAILEMVRQTGSLNKAARKLNMSYRHAWSYIRSAEKRLGETLLVKTKGGRSGGGAALTKYAQELLGRFNRLEERLRAFVDEEYHKTFQDEEIIK